MADHPIINFEGVGELAKPAEKLIEKVADGIGVLYEPTRIRRRAKAEADATEIETRNRISMDRLLVEAKIENAELAQRALIRLVQEEARAQENMEEVLHGATKYLNEDAEPEKIDDDWLTHFFGKCRAVSDKEMQALWSKILAGEANRAGSFSRRTVECVSTISKPEAEAFTRLCRHAWIIHQTVVPLIDDPASDLCKRSGINFSLLTTFDSIGLIHFSNLTGYMIQELPEVVRAVYCSDTFQLTIPDGKKRQLPVGHALFSPTGLELLRITQARRLDGMTEHVLEKWFAQGFAPASPWPKH